MWQPQRPRASTRGVCLTAALASIGAFTVGCGESSAANDQTPPDVSDASVGDGNPTDGIADDRPVTFPDSDACSVSCGSGCCTSEQRCFRDSCIPDNGLCSEGSEPCQNDSFCVMPEGVCVPYGVAPVGDRDEQCERQAEPLDRFEAEIQCEWPPEGVAIELPSSTSVVAAPLVGDLDTDGVPEIVFVTYPIDGTYAGTVRAIRGDTCEPVWTSNHVQSSAQNLAVADLDGDGHLEVCGVGANIPFCLQHDGSLLWDAKDTSGAAVSVVPGSYEMGLSVVNVDGVETPEVVAGLSVFRATTGVLVTGTPMPTRGMQDVYESTYALIPALADVDQDGHVEALTGAWVYDLVTGEVEDDWTGRIPEAAHGYTAVAELAAEHAGPEVVVVSRGLSQIRVHARDGTLLYQHAIPGDAGGPPTVADLDGDGHPEFSTASHARLTAFDLDCVGTEAAPPDPARCLASEFTPDVLSGVLWSVATREITSGFTGSSVFDFEGDGKVEVVYADECYARVFDGSTGSVKFSAPHESGTASEYPVIADVDGDLYTEIVVPHGVFVDNGCPAEDPLLPGVTRDAARHYAGITVYRDSNDRWAPSRPLWSQHAEHFDNRNDDGTVPAVETPSWTTHNSYRQALSRYHAVAAPDLTVGHMDAPDCDLDQHVQHLSAQVCNRGTLPAASGVVVAFHLDSPTGVALCTTRTGGQLEPGTCTDVGCDWTGVPENEPHEVYAVVDGAGAEGTVRECNEDNNSARLSVQCPKAETAK